MEDIKHQTSHTQIDTKKTPIFMFPYVRFTYVLLPNKGSQSSHGRDQLPASNILMAAASCVLLSMVVRVVEGNEKQGIGNDIRHAIVVSLNNKKN